MTRQRPLTNNFRNATGPRSTRSMAPRRQSFLTDDRAVEKNVKTRLTKRGISLDLAAIHRQAQMPYSQLPILNKARRSLNP